MTAHSAAVEWQRGDADFTSGAYSRAHTWRFDGGVQVPASASPHLVPSPHSVATAVDPEEAYVAALASCHMLWFLSNAARHGFTVDGYRDEASGTLARNADAKLAMTEVVLRPRVVFSGDRRPSPEEHMAMHHEAHESCFLASSVRTLIRLEPQDVSGSDA